MSRYNRVPVRKMEDRTRKRNLVIGIVVILALVTALALGLGLGLTLGRSKRDDTSRATDAPPTAAPTTPVAPTGPGIYRRAAVATDTGPCSDMGRDVLLEGGSAVDVAITAAFCVGVINPQSSGLGGGFFMVVYNKDGSTETLTANEAAPAASDFDMFVDDTDEAKYGARAVSVPGELTGLWEAHQRYGVLPWERLLRPVIDIAENGFQLTWHTVYTLKTLQSNFDRWPILRELYTRPDGSLMEPGDNVTAPPGLVQTLRAISTEGASTFHRGEVGKKLVQDIQDQGGVMTAEDLANYTVIWQQPSELILKDSQRRVLSVPVTACGDLVLFTVNILDECNLKSVNFSTYEGKLKLYHYFIEASTFAFGFRGHIGDAGTPEVEKTMAALSSKDYARQICSMINDTYVTFPSGSDYDRFDDLPDTADAARREKRADPWANQDENTVPDQMLGDTSHISVYSEQGDAVSLTTSVGRYFGSRFFSNQTGLFLNGHMSNFYYNGRVPAWEANKLAPGARAMSTMSPTIFTDEEGAVEGVIGTSGGLRIISTNAWVNLRILWGKEELSDVIDAPRVYAYRSATTSRTYYEENFPEDLLAGLRAMGHNMVTTTSFSVVQGIVRGPGNVIYAHSDRRKGGYPAGY